MHVFAQQGEHGPATTRSDVTVEHKAIGVGQPGSRQPLQCLASAATHQIAMPGAAAAEHAPPVGVPADIIPSHIALATNHAAIERRAEAKPAQEPKLEDAQPRGSCRSSLEPGQKLVKPRENRLLRLSWWAQPIAELDGVGSVRGLGDIRREPCPVVSCIERFEDHEFRASTIAKGRFAGRCHAKPPCESTRTFTCAAGQSRDMARLIPQQCDDEIRFRVGYAAKNDGRSDDGLPHETRRPLLSGIASIARDHEWRR